MPVSVLSVVLDADWEVVVAFSKITICEILTQLTMLNITGTLLSVITALPVCQLSAITLLTFFCPPVLGCCKAFLPHLIYRVTFNKKL